MLPTGYTYGRLSEPSALAAYLSLAGRSIPSLHGLRGRSTDTPVEQAAEVAVRLELEKKGEEVTSGGLVSRETSGREALNALREAGIEPPVDTAEHPTLEAALTSHTDGRTWVTFFERVTLEPRPNSCWQGSRRCFQSRAARAAPDINPVPAITPCTRYKPCASSRQSQF